MLLALSIISSQAAALGATAYKVFDEHGGTIGRVVGNDWLLPDPDNFVSSRHAVVRWTAGAFYLEDTSSNGTFLNAPDKAVSRGAPVRLQDGDRLFIGDFEIIVQLIDTTPAAPPGVGLGTVDPLAALGAGRSEPRGAPPLASMVHPAPAPATPASSIVNPAHAPALPPSSMVSPALALAPAAQGAGRIPDNWEPTGFNRTPGAHAAPSAGAPAQTPAAASQLAPAQMSAPAAAWSQAPAKNPASAAASPLAPAQSPALPAASPSASAQMPSSVPPPAGNAQPSIPASGAADLLAALGLDPARVDPAVQQQLGAILRIAVQGLMDVLKLRAEVKNNFRLPITIMKPVENNPLKFSMNAEDALFNLFVKRNPGYLGPVEAFEEGFQDASFHQTAVLAGVRAAFNAMLAKFHPTHLEEVYERKLRRTALLGLGKGGKFWELYRERFEEIDRDREAHFQLLFGEEFSRAYNEHLQKLAADARLRRR